MTSDLVFAEPEIEKVKIILHSCGLTLKNLKCSYCDTDLADLKHLRAIFPYESALICCDKFKCLLECVDKLSTKGL